jgi:hypothetical protein
MPFDVIVSVNRDQVGAETELAELAEGTAPDEPLIEESPLDAATVVSLIVAISSATYPFFKTWVASQVKRNKFHVSIDGLQIEVYNQSQAQKLLDIIERRFQDDSGKD